MANETTTPKQPFKMPEVAAKPVEAGFEGITPADNPQEAEKMLMKREQFQQLRQYINKRVASIVFGVLSPKMIRKMASAKIVTPELYDKEGYPVDGGLMDIRLGVIDPGLKCKTCGQKLKECIGHFGYIELARPVVHINFVRFILLALRCSCRECGRVLIPQDKMKAANSFLDRIEKHEGIDTRRRALKALVDKFKGSKKCPHCNAKQNKVVVEKPTTFMEGEQRISPIEVRARLERIPDNDVRLFGINPEAARPEWLILTVMAIPPVTIRPSITLESGERSEDDLTHKLSDIVRINQRLFENINAGAPEIIVEDLWDLLQYHVTTFFDNDVAQLPPTRHRSGQPLKTMAERLKSKEGRIRHNLAGKRTNFCARTVISPDPMIKINEVGVPRVIAMKLSVPETVTEWNQKYIKQFVSRGPKEYPGCNYIIRPDGKKKKITEETKEAALEELQPGYVVERHLMDGDIALFNRQPSLHRMSMMCHRVKVLPYRTLRLNPTVCHPYNADFDGDEMNLHIPQTEEARAEAEILMSVQNEVISPGNGLSIVSCLQDAVSGNYVITRNIEMPYKEAIELLASIGVTDFSRVPSKKVVTGKEIFSALFPADFNFVGQTKAGEAVLVKNGTLVDGHIDAANLGEGSGLIIRALHREYGPDKTIEVLQNMFRLGNDMLQKHGLSALLSDLDLPQSAYDQVETVLHDSEKAVQDLIKSYEQGALEVLPGRTLAETLELRILEVLNKSRNKAGTVVKENAPKDTSISIMVNAGAKGNSLTMAQMAAVVGQQALRGRRINHGYIGRTLSCFARGSLSPDAHGFIRSSYKKGMNPKEYFFAAITGRDSLMDTALRTPKSGYLYRRLANALQDVKVEYDGTVRESGGRIVQFQYGEDGVDVSRSENGKLDIKRLVHKVGE